MSKFDDFYNYAAGRSWNTYGLENTSGIVQWDYPLGGQCVSLIKTYLNYLGYGLKAYGNAIDYWRNRNSNGILNVCNVVSNPQNGDIVVSAGGDPRYGHIFIWKDGQAFTQNCCNNPKAVLYPLSYQGQIYGYLRPKCLVVSYNDSQLVKEDGVATFTRDKIVVRRGSPTGQDTGKRFNTGNKVQYNAKWVGNGHRYISWNEGGVRLFAAVSGSEQRGVDTWATFDVVPTPAPQPQPQPQPGGNNEEKNKLVPEKGRAYFRNSVPIIIHKDSPTGPNVGQFVNGEIQDYTEKYIGNGHRYISWLDPVVGNARCYAAVSATEQRPAEGSDEQWATFGPYGEEETSQPKPENPKPEFSDDPNGDNFLEKPDTPFEIFEPKSHLFKKYGIKLVTNIISKDLMPYKCPFLINKAFTITHNSGTNGNPSAETLSKSMANSKEQKSWHFSVDENTIIQNLPLNRNCWAAGDYSSGWKSKNGINLEICRDMDGVNSDKFEMAERNGAILVAELMYQNGWDKETIKKHQDFANKYCPHKTLDLGWDRYVDMIMEFLEEAKNGDKPEVKPEEKPEEKPEIKPEDNEPIKGGLVNKLLSLLINFFEKILSIFK